MKYYVVMCSDGKYSDRTVSIEKVFTDEEEAKKYLENLKPKNKDRYYYIEEHEQE